METILDGHVKHVLGRQSRKLHSHNNKTKKRERGDLRKK